MRSLLLATALIGSIALAEQRAAFQHTPPAEAQSMQPLRVEGDVTGGSFSKVVLWVRGPNEAYEDVSLELQYGDLYRGNLPASRMVAPYIEYWVEGVTASGDKVALFASASRPVRVTIAGAAGASGDLETNPYGEQPEKVEKRPPPRPKCKKGKKCKEPPPEPVKEEPDTKVAKSDTKKDQSDWVDTTDHAAVTKPEKVEKAPEKTPDKVEKTEKPPEKVAEKIDKPEKAARGDDKPPPRKRTELEEELELYGAEAPSGFVQRIDESARVVPQTPTILTAQQLKQLGVRYVHEALELVPGVSVSRDVQGFYRIAVRGLRSDAETLITLNGQRLNNFYDAHALATLPVDNLARIELYRGPATADVGLGNFIALINLVTDREDGLRVSGTGGLYEAFDGHLSGAKTFGAVKVFGDADVASQFGYRRSVARDGLDATTAREKTTSDKRFLVNVGLGAAYESEGAGTISVSGRFMLENRSALLGLFDVVGPDSQLGWQVIQAGASWKRPFGDGHQVSARLWFDQQTTRRLWQLTYDGYQARSSDPSTLFPDGIQELVATGTRGGGLEARVDLSLPGKNHLVAGLSGETFGLFDYDYRVNYVSGSLVNRGEVARPDLRFPTGSGQGSRGPAADRVGFGVFAYDTWSPFDIFSVQAGLRFDLTQVARGDATGAWVGNALVPSIGPRLGLTVAPTNSLVLRGSYGRAFRAPTPMELADPVYNSDSNQGRFVGNPQLEGEYIDSVEVGGEYVQGIGDGKLRLKAQAFFERISNAIAMVDNTGNLVPYRNRPLGVQAIGLEGEARLELTQRATAWLNASWVRAEDVGTPPSARLLTDVPQVRLNAGVSFPLGPYLNFDVITRLASERRNNSRSVLELIRRYTLPGYATVAAQLRTERLFDHLELIVLGQNVFAWEYADDAMRPDRVTNGVPRETYGIFGTARVTF